MVKHRIVLLLCLARSLLSQPSHFVELNWVWQPDGGGIATGFTIKRGIVTGGPYTQVGVVNGPAFSAFIDFGPFVEGQTYYYVVTAVGPGGESPASNEASATIPAASFSAALTLSRSAKPSTVGQAVTFTASLPETAGYFNGTVQFFDGNVLLGSSAIVSGQAVFTTSTLTKGSHAITAKFNGGVAQASRGQLVNGSQNPARVATASVGVFRAGLWVLDFNGNGQWDGLGNDRAVVLGQAGDIPVLGDWNGDGHAKLGIFRNGVWVLDYNGNGQWDGLVNDRAVVVVQAGHIPVVGDWNGDGRAKVGLFRNGVWVLDYNGNGQWDGLIDDRAMVLGQAGDIPVVGDWNGNGRAKVGLFRNGVWVLDYNGNGQWDGLFDDRAMVLGQAGDIPVFGNWITSGYTPQLLLPQPALSPYPGLTGLRDDLRACKPLYVPGLKGDVDSGCVNRVIDKVAANLAGDLKHDRIDSLRPATETALLDLENGENLQKEVARVQNLLRELENWPELQIERNRLDEDLRNYRGARSNSNSR